ncbi:MAG: pitrilysin family protein [Gemmatimonadaceae bacterium]
MNHTRPQPGLPRDYHFPKFEIRSLDNGIRIIIASVRKLPVVTVLAVIDATAVADPKGKEGLAELVAQALRDGTPEIDGSRLVLELERLGTSLEAGADWDSTVASMTVLRDKLEDAFRLFSDVVMSPAFRAEDIDRLRAERLAERLQILDEPRGLAEESFARFLYADGSRFAEPMSGSSESVTAISREDVVEFHEANYAPDATTIIIAGDLSADDGMALVENAFGKWSGRRAPKTKAIDSQGNAVMASQIVSKADAAQAELRIGHVGVPRSHQDYFSIVVMNAVLGGLFSSRINLNLREAHGYTYGASSYYDWRRQAGPFVISTAVQTEVTGNAITETLKEIDRMRGEEIDASELSLATSYLEGVFPIRYETTAAIAAALANMVTFELPEDYYDVYRSKVSAVTTTDVLHAAKEYVNPERLQIVVVGDTAALKSQIEALQIGQLSVLENVTP